MLGNTKHPPEITGIKTCHFRMDARGLLTDAQSPLNLCAPLGGSRTATAAASQRLRNARVLLPFCKALVQVDFIPFGMTVLPQPVVVVNGGAIIPLAATQTGSFHSSLTHALTSNTFTNSAWFLHPVLLKIFRR